MNDDAISNEDRNQMSEFVLSSPRLTYGSKVKEFENKWSEWLGVKHSVFVNSGSSANLLIVQATHDLYGQGNWAAQSCTWATNIAPIIQLQKDTGIFLTDIDLYNMGPDLDTLKHILMHRNIKYFFLTHVLGLPSITKEFLDLCNSHGVTVFEDCCESHGSTINGKKVGTTGLASSFSFFYGHHITTVEGGMICTNDDDFYHRLLLLRSHGLLRELPEEERIKHIVPDIDERFTFLCSGYNVRNTDIHAVLGLNQMKRLDNSVEIRNRNFKHFCNNIDSSKYHSDFITDGVSSFAIPIICKNVNKKEVELALDKFGIEFRPLIAGNLMRHPMMNPVNTCAVTTKSDFIHDNSFYVGNNEWLSLREIDSLIKILNGVS